MKKTNNKSSRHSKISGNFGEILVLYWLSKHGIECAGVDHTGIDIIARRKDAGKPMGISVKCRTRLKKGTEHESVTIRSGEFEKMKNACKEFDCLPYFAIVVDAKDVIRVFITSESNFLKHAGKKKNSYWKMTGPALNDYSKDEEVMAFELSAKTPRWWKKC
jgi:hypothetical protein